jgi:protein-S-isoprenylcysteine O-methyltransferase Ste14
VFALAGAYYRIQSQRSGERLDRRKEGWPLLIGIRLLGLLTIMPTAWWLWRPATFIWAGVPMPLSARWAGVAAFGCSVAWLLWMFHNLGRNLTDTVVTRRDAHLVEKGPYRFVRNPMYTGILMMGFSLGLALGTWLLPFGASLVFTLMAIRTRIEEKYLIARFGDRYRDYMNQVGRFVPKLSAFQK